MFPNPVKGTIHPKGWSRPSGNVEFVVTRTSADHVATNQGKGLDISSRRCNVDPVLAMAAGKVVIRDDTQGIIVLDHGTGYRTHYAHMKQLRYGVGASVALGAALGMVSDAHDPSITNFAGCHLHFGITRYISGAWVAQDPWPLLNQNGVPDMTITILRYPALRQNAVKAGTLVGYRPSPEPKTKSGTWSAASGFPADAEATFDPLPAGWPAGPYQRVTAGHYAGYYVNNAQVTLGPLPSGFTQADIDAAELAAAQAVADAAVKEAGKYR